MKNFKTIAIVLGFFLIIGWVGHQDYQTAKLEEAAATCETSTDYTIPTHAECMANQFEINNDR